jgi:O-succinylhomoserine sulfhydrylase
LLKNKKQTDAIRKTSQRSEFNEHSTPLYLTSSFTFDDTDHGRALFAEQTNGNIYTRFSNPNTTEFVNKMVSLEKMEDGFLPVIPDRLYLLLMPGFYHEV